MPDARKELFDLIIHRALDPVMRSRSEGRSDADQRALERMQRATETEIERCRNYGSAEELVINFKPDLHSAPAKRVHAELRRLHLPTLDDIRDDVAKRARELGVDAPA